MLPCLRTWPPGAGVVAELEENPLSLELKLEQEDGDVDVEAPVVIEEVVEGDLEEAEEAEDLETEEGSAETEDKSCCIKNAKKSTRKILKDCGFFFTDYSVLTPASCNKRSHFFRENGRRGNI